MIRKSHMLLIKKLVWSFHKTSSVEWDELFAEACYHYWNAMNNYKPDKANGSKKTTYIYTLVTNGLINFLKKEQRHETASLVKFEMIVDQTPFFELFDSLSEDSKIIAEMVLSNPHEYLSMPSKMARGLVVSTLVKDKNWTWTRVWDGLRNIKTELVKV